MGESDGLCYRPAGLLPMQQLPNLQRYSLRGTRAKVALLTI